jgi:transposase-like protein
MTNSIGEHMQMQKTGLKCPLCGAFIETSIFQLLTASALMCPSCHLCLRIDRTKSRPAFDALRKVQAAQRNLERKSKFG